MQAVVKQRGIAFFIIRFATLERDFVVPFHVIEESWCAMGNGQRKSIPLAVFETQGIELKPSYHPRLDYIQAMEQLISTD